MKTNLTNFSVNRTSADITWAHRLDNLLFQPINATPRGKPTHELIGPAPIIVDMSEPLVTNRARKLSYTFAAAEALWIIDGRTDVESLAKYNQRMRDFSDDGVTLAGAYGPAIEAQFDYVIEALMRDPDTRQAALTIWKPCPKPSRDIPCTIALVFQIRVGRLYTHVMMRSSDIWLGVPYDIFSFSMVSARVACLVNQRRIAAKQPPVVLGNLHLYAASSHLYTENEAAAIAALERPRYRPSERVPEELIRSGDWAAIRGALERCRDTDADTDPVWAVRPQRINES